jgi:predicted DNA-binding transcriptional regulator AlpA
LQNKQHHAAGHRGVFGGSPCGWDDRLVTDWILNRIRRSNNATPRPESDTPPRIIRWAEVHTRTGLSRTAIWRLERDGKFPPRIRLFDDATAGD